MALRRLFIRTGISPPDTAAPSVPSSVTVSEITTGTASVSWGASSDNRSVAGYEVELNGSPLASAAGIGKQLTGMSPDTAQGVRVRAFDNSGNYSAWSSTVNFNTLAEGGSGSGGGSKNWNPGNYVRPDHRGTPVKDNDHTGAIDAVLAATNTSRIAGILVPVPWARIENAQNTYTWTWLDDRIEYITKRTTSYNGKKVILNLEMYSYGTSTVPSTPQATNDAIIPDYIIDAGWGGGGNGIMPKIDVSGCRDRVINIMAQLFTRYGDSIDVEMIGLGETSRDYVGINSSNYNDNWILIAEALVDQAAGKKAWGFIDHNGLLTNDYAKQRTLQNIMDNGGIAYSTADIVGFFSKSATPPGVDISVRGGSALLEHMNYGYTAHFNYDFTNPDGTDRRLWVPNKAEHQVIRPTDLTNEKVRWYSDNWYKNTHPVWTLRIGAGGASYGADLYGTSTPAPAEFNGSNTLAYLVSAGVTPANTTYPTGPV